MSIRISASTVGEHTTVRIDGRLEAEFVPDLLAEASSGVGMLRLELTGLQSADGAGLRTLRSLREDGAVLEGASPYIRELLDGGS